MYPAGGFYGYQNQPALPNRKEILNPDPVFNPVVGGTQELPPQGFHKVTWRHLGSVHIPASGLFPETRLSRHKEV